MNDREAQKISSRWRQVIWGDNQSGGEYELEVDGQWYIVTIGTGDGNFAYKAEDVRGWLDEHEDDLFNLDDDTGGSYQSFCDNVSPVEDHEVAVRVYSVIGVVIDEGGTCYSQLYEDEVNCIDWFGKPVQFRDELGGELFNLADVALATDKRHCLARDNWYTPEEVEDVLREFDGDLDTSEDNLWAFYNDDRPEGAVWFPVEVVDA